MIDKRRSGVATLNNATTMALAGNLVDYIPWEIRMMMMVMMRVNDNDQRRKHKHKQKQKHTSTANRITSS